MPRNKGFIARMMSTGVGLLSRARLPKVNGALRLAGLHAPVEVIRDDWGVPHIYAKDSHDLFFSQGFVHAQDRLWQMDYNRRLAAGRMAEILGPVALPLDRWMRTLTLRRVAEYEASIQDEDTQAHLQAYANGVNAHLAQGRLSVEFSLLRYRPEPWVIADSLAWKKMMAWSLSVNWEAELLRAQLIALLGPELASELEPPALQRWPTVLPPGIDYTQLRGSALDRARIARLYTGPSPYEGVGSNCWAVSGQLTASGSPLLANDMHLGLTTPAIWYENHIICPEFNVFGVSLPGLPGIVAGHNGNVAWGFTNGFPDVQDLYIERLRHSPEGMVEAEYNGAWETVRVLKEKIHVKGEDPVTEEVIITRHGPVINSLAPDFTGETPLALRWTALEPDTMLAGMFEMLSAKNVDEFHQALRHWCAPVQHVVFADIDGKIAYTFPGKLPVRARGSGKVPVPGWTDEYEWLGYINFEDLPHQVDPEQGYIASANNRAVGSDYPVRIDLEPISGDRAQRISEMILDAGLRNGKEKIDREHMQAMQYDQASPSARIIARTLGQMTIGASAHNPQTELHAAIQLFRDWDGTLPPNSTSAALYQVFIRRMTRLMLDFRLEALAERYMGKGPNPILADTSLTAERWLPWLTKLFSEPDSHWFNLGNGERRDDVIWMALEQSVKELSNRLGPDPKRWTWGRLHQVTFRHILSGHPALAAVFNIGPFKIGGDHTTLWASGASYHDLDTTSMIGPPYRMIVDLGDLDASLSMLAPGQSGHLSSPHFRDQVKSWFSKGYHPMLYKSESVRKHARHTLSLAP